MADRNVCRTGDYFFSSVAGAGSAGAGVVSGFASAPGAGAGVTGFFSAQPMVEIPSATIAMSIISFFIVVL
jgi:hypothetical protein